MSKKKQYMAELEAKFPEFEVDLVKEYNNQNYTYCLKADESNLAFSGQLNDIRNKGFTISYIDFMDQKFHVNIIDDSK